MPRRSGRYGLRDPVAFFESLRPARQACTDQLRNLAILGAEYRAMLDVIAALDAAADLFIAARVGRAQAAELETIWFEEIVIPACGKRPEKIVLEPLTYYGLQARLRSASKRAGINMARVIHGARHHAGTVMLGKTGNLKLTQQLLGHADIKSTLRYAHALEADLRAALDHQEGEDGAGRPARSRSKR